MIEIRLSNVSEMLANAQEMFVEHWDEIALNKRVMKLKVDEDRYKALEATGSMLILGAYDGEALIGYSVNFMINHLHYADLKICSNDVLFIKKEYRQGRLGLMMIAETERQAKEMGAELILWHAKKDTALEAIMPKIGYGIQDIIFSKEL